MTDPTATGPRSPAGVGQAERRADGRRASNARTGALVLLGAQLLFNVGFYAVVPFLALVLTESFGLAGGAVGLVLGVRTFAQQGMFLFGGVLADRFGARPVILLGCAVRVAGFLTLAASLWTAVPLLGLFVAGTVLTGLGGALFSPALNTLIAGAETRRSQPAKPRRVTLFAWLSITGEIGAVVGPLLGAVLLGWGFAVVAASGGVFFTAIALLLWWALPRPSSVDPAPRAVPAVPVAAVPRRSWSALRDRRFLLFAALHAADLLAYNQLYLTLPLELARAGSGPGLVGLMFAWVSILTLVLQLPVARWGGRAGASVALRAGYCLSATGFIVLAVSAILPVTTQGRLVTVLIATTLLTLGHLTTGPTALSLVPLLAGARPTGSYFGLLSTFGGIAVLVGNLVAGLLLGVADGGLPSAFLPWCFLALPLILAAALVPRVLRSSPTRESLVAT